MFVFFPRKSPQLQKKGQERDSVEHFAKKKKKKKTPQKFKQKSSARQHFERTSFKRYQGWNTRFKPG